MKFWILSILFITATGEEVLLDGWHPIQQPSLEVCEKRKEFLDNYMKTTDLPEYIQGYKTECKEITW